jgi:hypothetical protein
MTSKQKEMSSFQTAAFESYSDPATTGFSCNAHQNLNMMPPPISYAPHHQVHHYDQRHNSVNGLNYVCPPEFYSPQSHLSRTTDQTSMVHPPIQQDPHSYHPTMPFMYHTQMPPPHHQQTYEGFPSTTTTTVNPKSQLQTLSQPQPQSQIRVHMPTHPHMLEARTLTTNFVFGTPHSQFSMTGKAEKRHDLAIE